MPKFWRFRPEPINAFERYLMLLFGSVIDLSPLTGMIYGLIFFFKQPNLHLISGILLVFDSVLFLILVYYFSKVLLGYRCIKCLNFSCSMNKVEETIIQQILDKNPLH